MDAVFQLLAALDVNNAALADLSRIRFDPATRRTALDEIRASLDDSADEVPRPALRGHSSVHTLRNPHETMDEAAESGEFIPASELG